MHPTVPYLFSGISGTLYGYLAAKTNLGGDIIKALVSGDPYQMIGAGVITTAVIGQLAEIRQYILSKKDDSKTETMSHAANGLLWAAIAYHTAQPAKK